MTHRLFVATRKGVFTLAPRTPGGEWEITDTAFLGDNATSVMCDPRDGAVYVALAHGHFGVKLHRADADDGRFREVATPTYPDKPDDIEDLEPMRRIPIPWSTQLLWTLEPSTAARPGTLWCGTIPGGLFRSGDRGESWQLNAPLWHHPSRSSWFGGGYDFPGIHSICIEPNLPDRITVGVSCGGVWRSDDHGATWTSAARGMWAAYVPPARKHEESIQDPHRIVQCPTAAEHFWAQHHNGVFRTTNGCTDWEEVTAIRPSSFGFAVAVHPQDPDTAWFVPAVSDEQRIPVEGRVVVTRTRDGGQTFETLTRGLPQQHGYDLTFRHALDISADGKILAFGTTTGSLWISVNGGDRWRNISHHLPPVHAVRFDTQ